MSRALAKIKMQEARQALACAQANLGSAAAMLPAEACCKVAAESLRFLGATIEEQTGMLEQLIKGMEEAHHA